MRTKPENWQRLGNREYRHSLAAAQFKRFVPFQISALRKERKWSQEVLAEKSGLTQGVISRAEDPDNGNLTVNTVLRIANGFDVVFVGKFVPYTEFEEWRRRLSEETIVPDYEKENEKLENDSIAASTNESTTEDHPSLKVLSQHSGNDLGSGSFEAPGQASGQVVSIDAAKAKIARRSNDNAPEDELLAVAAGAGGKR